MNLDWYYTFVILAKTLNYRLASEEINLTIPSIHKQIKNLEQHLNVKLFETYKNQIILTEDGHTFLPIAQSFIEQYESGIKHIQLKKNDVSIEIKCCRVFIYRDIHDAQIFKIFL